MTELYKPQNLAAQKFIKFKDLSLLKSNDDAKGRRKEGKFKFFTAGGTANLLWSLTSYP